MAIKIRTNTSNPRREKRLPPTQSSLSLAAYRLADELGQGQESEKNRDAAAGRMYEVAETSVSTAWGLVNAAIMAVRCRNGRRRVAGVQGDIVSSFRNELEKAYQEDLAKKTELLEQLKTTEGEAKKVLEEELKNLLLHGIPQGKPLQLGSAATAYLVNGIVTRFRPVLGSPLEQEDLPRMVKENIRFFDWLGVELLFSDKEVEEYRAVKDEDKLARAETGGSPAPEETASQEDAESDKDSGVPVAEETEAAPAAASA